MIVGINLVSPYFCETSIYLYIYSCSYLEKINQKNTVFLMDSKSSVIYDGWHRDRLLFNLSFVDRNWFQTKKENLDGSLEEFPFQMWLKYSICEKCLDKRKIRTIWFSCSHFWSIVDLVANASLLCLPETICCFTEKTLSLLTFKYASGQCNLLCGTSFYSFYS